MDKISIGIVGSRSRNSENDLKCLYEFLENFLKIYKNKDIEFVSGGCPKGADHFAEIIAKDLNIPIRIFYPDKNVTPFRKAAFDRNTLIAKNSNELIAMVAENRKGGTEDTIRKFIKFKNKNPILI